MVGVSTVDQNDQTDQPEQAEQLDLRLLWLLLIPGILIGAIFVHVITSDRDDASPSSATSDLVVSIPQQVGRCAVPTAEQLAQQSTAVRANVIATRDDAVELRVTNVLAGPQIGLITVSLPPEAQAHADTSLPAFELNHSYLLAISADGKLAGCGLSGASDTTLEDLYSKAFG